ncbi:MBL fold metallo-hydrolase [Thermocoleostomius sinensis]|uniref:MBL fold metallo-hydrolase n=1 Tax=Thermocoleostomius sinensis A174 TaxID=2016057 RepID=A0A9E8ZA15_9CYAN|nr:MBL fold metallo-hydrolase [Thermocoleostomius sinensis]WAL59002.1 MBL fold metallo-hydrolase [Thermocoleostomius sinensis A174]
MNPKFSRRLFLQLATGATIASALPITWRQGATAQESAATSLSNAPFYRFKLGEFEVISISDGIINAPAALFAGNAPATEVAEVLEQAFQTETLTLDCNVLFVNTGSHNVLVDVGGGSMMAPTAGKLLNHLQTVQLSPADIDTIIITHAHVDHIGGVLDAADAFVFPDAQYFVSRTEYEFWTDPQVSLARINIDEPMRQQFISVAQRCLGAISDRVTLVEPEQEIIPGFHALAAPGHTPGQIAVRITSNGESLIHTADVVHTHTVNLWNVSWQPIFDFDADQAVATRQQTLASIAAERHLMFAYHFPFPGLGHLRRRSEGGFAWEPVQWQFDV